MMLQWEQMVERFPNHAQFQKDQHQNPLTRFIFKIHLLSTSGFTDFLTVRAF
jgi:hypothetical protein